MVQNSRVGNNSYSQIKAINVLRSPPGWLDFSFLLALAILWGSSFVLIKIAVASVPAVSTTAGRLLCAAALFLVLLGLGDRAATLSRRDWLWVLGVAITGNVLPFALISWAEETIDSGIASILMAIMPLATILLAHFFTADERLNAHKISGAVLGLSGLIILIGPQKLLHLGDDAVHQLAVVLAAVCYAVSAIFTKRLVHVSPVTLGTAVMSLSALIVLPIALVLERPWTLAPSPGSIAAIVALGIFPTALAMLLLYQLIQRQGASFFSQINFLVPPTGFFLGAWLLGERPGINAYIALAVILAGIAISRRGMSA